MYKIIKKIIKIINEVTPYQQLVFKVLRDAQMVTIPLPAKAPIQKFRNEVADVTNNWMLI